MKPRALHLLRFGIENFKSFRDYTELFFTATAVKDSPSFLIPDSDTEYGVLPVIGIYGANASGKSNLVDALLTFKRLVKYSFYFQAGEAIPWQPWRLDLNEDKPTRFDLDFSLDGIRHQYGFQFVGEAFQEEWLYRWPNGRRQVLFERDVSEKEPWYFGPSLTGEKVALAKRTRPNALFVSTAAQHNHDLLGDLQKMLSKGIREESHIELRGYPVFAEGAPILEAGRRETVIEILNAFDLGCTGIEVEEIPGRELGDLEGIEEIFKPEALEIVRAEFEQKPLYRYRLVLKREDPTGHSWDLPALFESSGTNVLLQRINDLMAMDMGILIVDELETSLHPEVCAALLELFTSSEANTSHVQLLFTTHNRSLLDYLRRDEAQFVEKDAFGVSTFFSGADFRDLKSAGHMRRAYEEGRFGATPIVGDIGLIWAAK